MTTRQIKKYEDNECRHPEHKPPEFKLFEPGEYEHTCPSCGDVFRFNTPLTIL